jgi:hypothetical protein
MVKDGPVAHFIDDLAAAIKWVDGKIADPKFGESVDSFISGVGKLVTSVGGLVHSLASWASWLGVGSAEAATNPTGATGAGPGGGCPRPYGASPRGWVFRGWGRAV